MVLNLAEIFGIIAGGGFLSCLFIIIIICTGYMDNIETFLEGLFKTLIIVSSVSSIISIILFVINIISNILK